MGFKSLQLYLRKYYWPTMLMVALLVLIPKVLNGQANNVVLDGVALVRISETGSNRIVETLEEEVAEVTSVVQKIGDRYLWTTRDNTELRRYDHGTFITYVAEDGSGYIRVFDQDMRTMFDGLNELDGVFDYLEHFPLGLTTVTYYGRLRKAP
ncbi:MAG: hypothetical protein CMP01_05215 [Woeseiaceae bacterium]|jgi:hypothetical protein|nr:hypothetical protein [Woeseiaceae bacterium]|tara:strand:- start:1376 stop:1834 length:459 start_codon:yes stop_codon:yes gene_type:complete